jgi:hypothetical protein
MTDKTTESKSMNLNKTEKIKALIKNKLGFEKTKELIGTNDKEIESWIKDPKTTAQHKRNLEKLLRTPAETPSKSKTLQKFPEEYGESGKLSRFLLRLTTISGKDKQVQQATLILKLEDRTDNISKMKTFKGEKQRDILRATITRLLAWAMLDHNHAQMPLYNALPRTIDTTLEVYENLKNSHNELIEDIDHQLIEQLKEWQTDVIHHELPAKVQAVLDRYNDKK